MENVPRIGQIIDPHFLFILTRVPERETHHLLARIYVLHISWVGDLCYSSIQVLQRVILPALEEDLQLHYLDRHLFEMCQRSHPHRVPPHRPVASVYTGPSHPTELHVLALGNKTVVQPRHNHASVPADFSNVRNHGLRGHKEHLDRGVEGKARGRGGG